MKKEHELKVVSIRLVDDPPLLSSKKVETMEDAVNLMGDELRKYDRELLCVLNMRTNGQVINMNVVSMGSLNGTMTAPRELFKSAILSNAAGIILMHNHPSGSCKPSKEDRMITKRMATCGAMLGINVLDHIIVGSRGQYYSFYENKEMSKLEWVEEKAAENPMPDRKVGSKEK